MAHVLILGGGFGGLAAAHELRQHLGDEHEITLVARDDGFFIGFAKLWDLAGMRPLADGTGDLNRLDGHGVRFVQAEVTAIDPQARLTRTSDGELSGDALLVALGAGVDPEHGELIAGAGHDLYDAAALPAMRRDLAGLDGGRLVISILGGPFKCPPAPYEAALLIDEQLRHRGVRDQLEIVLTTPQPISLPAAGPDASRYVADRFAERDIELRTETPVSGVDREARELALGDGERLEYALWLAVPASAPVPVLAESPLAGASGWIEPDRHTLRTDVEGVYAVGDCTMVATATGQLPKAGVFAEGEGKVAARNIVADLGGGEGDRFDGHGFCFLEFPGEEVAFVSGDFYAEPAPDVEIEPPTRDRFAAKRAFERERLAAWLG